MYIYQNSNNPKGYFLLVVLVTPEHKVLSLATNAWLYFVSYVCMSLQHLLNMNIIQKYR